jgi:diacylglycerol kinase family enzyme
LAAPALAEADELWVHGGDGTLHRVLTAVHRAKGSDPEATFPTVSVLRAGTMNIVADSLGQRASAAKAVEAAAAGKVARVEHASPMLVDVGEDAPCLGFLAGGGIISRFLEVYYESPDPTPVDAGVLLAQGAASALVGGRLARRLTRPFEGELRVDGELWAGGPWMAVALGSVDQLGLGFTPFPRIRHHPGRVHVIGISSHIAALALELPRVWLGRGVRRSGNREARATDVEMVADEPIPFMVDGDFYAGSERVRVRMLPPVRFQVW